MQSHSKCLTSPAAVQDAAAEYLPHLEFASGMSVPFIDTLGHSYHFRFRFWQNTSRIFLLEGTQEMQASR